MNQLFGEAAKCTEVDIYHEYMSLYAPVLLHRGIGEGEFGRQLSSKAIYSSPQKPQPRVLYSQPEVAQSQRFAVDRSKALLTSSSTTTTSAAAATTTTALQPPPPPLKAAGVEEITRSCIHEKMLIQRAFEVIRREKATQDHRVERNPPEEPNSKEAIQDRCMQIEALQQERIRRKEYLGTQKFPLLEEPPTNKNATQDASNKKDQKSMGVRDAQWESHFERLKSYKEEHGHTMVPTHYPPDIQLGNWVRNQRLNYKNNGITEARKQRLNEIGFMWVFYDRSTSRWEEMFERLSDYVDKHGDANVPLRYTKDPQLGAWVNYQRTTQRQGKLSVQKVSKLDSLDFDWNPMKHAATWEHMLWRLLAYKNSHGHTKVPFRYKADPQLGYWVSNQRAFYRKKRLSRDRQILLESAGLFPRANLLSSTVAANNNNNNNNNARNAASTIAAAVAMNARQF